MHAIYTFLMHIDASCVEDQTILDEAETQLSDWLDRRGDGNNHHHLVAVIFDDGRVVDIPGKLKNDIGDELPFGWAKRLAMDCLCTDAGLMGPRIGIVPPTHREAEQIEQLKKLGWDELNRYFVDKVSRQLSELYANLNPEEDELADYRRSQMARRFEYYRGSGYKPFATSGTPYDYRAFDLTDGDYNVRLAIALVDIHT